MAGDVNLAQLQAMTVGRVALAPYVPVHERGPQDTAITEVARLLDLNMQQSAEISRLRMAASLAMTVLEQATAFSSKRARDRRALAITALRASLGPNGQLTG